MQRQRQPPPDQIVIADNVSEVVFTPDGPGEQTLSFTSNAPWKISVDKIAFMRFTPSQGDAGTVTVTIQPFEPMVNADIKGVATITAGTATATFNISQIAPTFVQEIRIVAPQNKLPIGKTMTLAIEAVPEDGVMELVQWSSSDSSVLSVDREGEVTALAVGNAVVTAVSGSLSAQCALEVTEAFTTDGTGKTYTFKQLSELGASGVEAKDGSYVLTANIVIAEKDNLKLGDGERVKIRDKVELKILGKVDFNPTTEAMIQRYDATATPAPIYFSGTEGGGVISNVKLAGCPIRFFGEAALTISKCEFIEIRSKYAAINLGGSGQVIISECKFLENDYPAIAGGSNMPSPLIFKDNYLYKNSKNTTNRP